MGPGYDFATAVDMLRFCAGVLTIESKCKKNIVNTSSTSRLFHAEHESSKHTRVKPTLLLFLGDQSEVANLLGSHGLESAASSYIGMMLYGKKNVWVSDGI